jgi:hypothetical protein
MTQEEPDKSESKVDSMTRQIHRVVIEGEGSATVVEFQCERESYWLLIEMKGKSASARWLQQDELGHLRLADGSGGIDIPPFPRRV